MAVKNFVLMKENTCRSNLISQNYTSYYQLTVSESNRLNTPVIFAWLSIKAISKQQNGQKHEQHEAEQENVVKLYVMNSLINMKGYFSNNINRILI